MSGPVGRAPGDDPPPADTGTDPLAWNDPIRVATFNIDWLSPRVGERDDFEPRNEVDHAQIRDLIEAHDLSLVGLQEIEGSAALATLGFDDRWSYTVGESGWSQNLAILYRNDRMRLSEVREIHLPGTEFPSKDPLVARVEVGSLDMRVVVVHFNPYEDPDDAAYRYHQMEELRAWLDVEVDPIDEQVLVLGDFNDDFDPLNASWPSLSLLEAPPTWTFATREADGASTIYYNGLIDHLVLSEALLPAWEAEDGGAFVIRHDRLDPWSSYTGGQGERQNISSHRPVWIPLAVE